MKKLLIIVDPQNDFITGSLAVPGAEEAMTQFAMDCQYKNLLEQYDGIAITIDNHPSDHCSFTAQGGPFPSHCVNHTIGAAISSTVEFAINKYGKNVKFYTKGELSNKEEFSIFGTYYKGYQLLFDAGLTNIKEPIQIDVMGIAGDYCVHDTIVDLINIGHKSRINVLCDYIASIDGGTKLNDLIKENDLKTL